MGKIERYRQTMAGDVLHSWAADAQKELDQLRADVDALLARIASDEKKLDALLVHCPDGECGECSKIICEHGDPMHFHHDGCPSCWQASMAAEEG